MDVEQFTWVIPLLTGVIVPFITGLVVKKSWSSPVKGIIAFVMAVIISIVTLLVQGEFKDISQQNLMAHIGVTFTGAMLAFWLIVETIPGLKDWLLAHGIKDAVRPPLGPA